MKFLLLLALSVFSISSAAFAGSCYSEGEAEAEQGIRIHSELMVIGLNCAHMADANGNNLYMEHKKFTSKHHELFETYETILMDYMGKNGVKAPEKGLHKLRTEFANKISKDAAEMRPDIFCRTYSSRIEQAAKLDNKAFRKWAATHFEGHEVSKPICKASL